MNGGAAVAISAQPPAGPGQSQAPSVRQCWAQCWRPVTVGSRPSYHNINTNNNNSNHNNHNYR